MHTGDVFHTLARIRGSRDSLLQPYAMAAIYEKLQACSRADDATKQAHVEQVRERWRSEDKPPFTPKTPAVF
jgi:hypothetical protein